jgi:hypothetical protein
MKDKPHAVGPGKHMVLVSFISFILRDRCSKYSVHDLCQEASATFGGQPLFGSFYTHIYRNPWLYRQYSEHGPDSLWLLVRDIYYTLLRKI